MHEKAVEEVEMAHYTTRVELHDAEEEDYETLHEAMEDRGFTRTIKRRDGTTYKLPSEEYNYEGEIKIGEVLEDAKSAAATTGLEYGILVSEAPKRRWHGLEEQ